ncbi:MAG: hypothetical protein AAF363_07385 [Bacteroidota bacterium]
MNEKDVQSITHTLNNHPHVLGWTVDLMDWERVLRIEASDSAAKLGIIECIKMLGFECEDLNH